jgi:hypothetical protein
MDSIRQRREIGVRAHAAAFGYSPPDHVFRALEVMQADVFFLLENEDDKAYKYHLQGKVKVDLHKELDKRDFEWERVEVDLWNPAQVGGCLQRIVEENDLEELLVNASVGPNTVAIGAMLASLFAPVRLFHPGGDQPSEPLQQLKDVRWLPTLKMPGWSAAHVQVLDALAALGGRTTGKMVKEWLRSNAPDAIGSGQGRGNWAQKEHGRFQALMERLRDAGAVDVSKARRRWDILLRPEGEQLRLLLYRVRPRNFGA